MSTRAADILKQVPGKLLDRPVSDLHLAHIARELENWEELGILLGLTTAQQEEVRRDFYKYSDQKREAFRKWRELKGPDATYRQLIITLCCVQNVELANNIKDLLVPPASLKDTSTSVWDTFREYLIDCCKAARHPSHEQWPLLCISTYVELTLREVPTKDDTNVKEVRLSQIFVSSHKASRRFVLIEGPPGSGKTTLTWHALQEWAEGKLFQQFSLLIPISLSNADPTVLDASCLADIIPHESKDMRENVAKIIAEKSGKGVCFFIDSWDEAPMSFFQQRSYLHHLIMGGTGKKSLPHCSIVVTSRPVASVGILRFATSRLVINGFNLQNIEEFIYSTLASDKDGDKFVYMLQAKQELFALCHSPLLLSIAMHIFTTSSHDLPSTQTELFTALVLSKLIRHKSLRAPGGNDLEEVEDINNLPDNVLIKFRGLCKLAYIGLRECRSLFSVKDIKECGVVPASDTLSLMKVFTQKKQSGIRSSYSFLHLTIQEYLVAYHINSLDPEEQREAIEQLLMHIPLTMAISFYAGLSKLENRGVLDVLLKVSEMPLDWLSVLKQLKEHDNSGFDPRRLFLTLVNSIYESRNLILYRSFQPENFTPNRLGGRGVEISMCSFYLTPTYCLSFGHFLNSFGHFSSLKGWVSLNIPNCNITDVGFPLIVKEVCGMDSASSQVCNIELNIANNPITHRALECMRYGLGRITAFLFGVHKHPGFIVFLALKYLTEGVSRSPCFIFLSVEYTITIKHMYHLLLLMISSKSLRTLLVNNNDLRGAIPILSVGLKYNMNIKSLSLENCSLEDRDLHELGNAFYHSNALVSLHIGGNNFTSGELTAFLKAIRDSKSKLCVLYYEGELNTAQQEVVEEIQLWQKANRLPPLKIGPLAATLPEELLKMYEKLHECSDIMQNLPPSLLTGINNPL